MKIKVLMFPTDRPPYVTNISATLENMQKIVGGYIEALEIADGCIAIMNEEGRIKNLPENDSFPIAGIRGNAFICGKNGEDFAGIPENSVKFLLKEGKDRFFSRMMQTEFK